MPKEPIGKITSGADGSDQTNRDRSNDGTVVINPTFHKYKFMIPAMPWHMAECPKCEGRGSLIIEGYEEYTKKCDLCDGEGEVTVHRVKAWLRDQ